MKGSFISRYTPAAVEVLIWQPSICLSAVVLLRAVSATWSRLLDLHQSNPPYKSGNQLPDSNRHIVVNA